MTPSTFIARIFGPLLVVSGLGLLLGTEAFRAMAGEFLKNPALIYFSGFIALAIGLAILNLHHLWVRDWRVIITIFGWLAVIGGIFRILATSFVQRLGESAMTHPRGLVVAAVIDIVLGGFLAIMGYQAIWNDGLGRPQHRPGAAKASAAKGSAATSRTAKRPRQKSAATRSRR